jgi:outer membrane protein TolC
MPAWEPLYRVVRSRTRHVASLAQWTKMAIVTVLIPPLGSSRILRLLQDKDVLVRPERHRPFGGSRGLLFPLAWWGGGGDAPDRRRGREWLLAILFTGFSLVTLQPGAAWAENFAELVLRLENHPSVVAARAGQVSEQESASGALGLPDPAIVMGINNLPVENPGFDRFLPTSRSLGITQAIPNLGKRRAMAERFQETAQEKAWRADYQRATLEAELIGILGDLQKIDQMVHALNAQRQLYQELETWLQGRIEGGAADYGRFAELDSQRTEIDQKLNTLQGERAMVMARLTSLTGDPPTPPIPPPPEQSPRRWDEQDNALFPLMIAQAQWRAAQQEVAEKEAAFGPDVTVGASYQQREPGDMYSGEDWVSLNAAVTIPLWAQQNQWPKLRAAKARSDAAHQLYQDQRRQIKSQLDMLRAQYDTALRAQRLLQKKAESLTSMEEAARRNYEAGQLEWEAVLRPAINRWGLVVEQAKERAAAIKLSSEINRYFIQKP